MRSKKSFITPLMYPKFSGVPSTMPLHARTSSTVVSKARCTHTSTPSIASSFAPSTTASVIAAVPPDREWNTTSNRGTGTGSQLFYEARQVEREVLAYVADVLDDDVPAVETPLVVAPHERVAVTARHDRLERQRRGLLEHHEDRPRGRRPGDLVDVDHRVRVHVPRTRGAVVVDAVRPLVE